MTISRLLSAVAVAAVLAAGFALPALADDLVQPVQPDIVQPSLAAPVQPVQAGAAKPSAEPPALAKPVETAENKTRCPCGSGAAPVVGSTSSPSQPITGDLSNLPLSEQLKGREQALRAHFQQQMNMGTRPWLPVPSSD